MYLLGVRQEVVAVTELDTDGEQCIDEVVEQYPADQGTRADLVRRNGYREDQSVVKCYGTRQDRYSGFDGETTTAERKVKIAEMPENVTYEVLLALAEYHGYKLEGK